jgi:hypothetical protein
MNTPRQRPGLYAARQFPYLVVPGYFRHSKQGFPVAAPPSGFHRPLKMERRRVQEEKYGKRAHQRVRNPVPLDVPPTPYIGDAIPPLSQTAKQPLYDALSHTLSLSCFLK